MTNLLTEEYIGKVVQIDGPSFLHGLVPSEHEWLTNAIRSISSEPWIVVPTAVDHVGMQAFTWSSDQIKIGQEGPETCIHPSPQGGTCAGTYATFGAPSKFFIPWSSIRVLMETWGFRAIDRSEGGFRPQLEYFTKHSCSEHSGMYITPVGGSDRCAFC